MISDNNKRIAKNTALLYVRMIFTQLIALYTSRKILEVLGVEDFGIYNVVGSVVGMLTFLNGSMSVATARFLTIELGKKDLQSYNRVFGMAVIIHLVIAVVIFIAAETVGLWWVNTYLNIPAERMLAANWVYQTSMFMVLIGIIQTPYMASLTAHEHLNVYAYVGMGESVMRLVVVFLLLLSSWDKLIIYGILLLSVQMLIASIYRIYCIRYFEVCRFRWQWDKGIFHSMLGFTGWNMFGTLAWLFKDQGGNMLMNIFGSPVINAARGVSYQVSGAVKNLVGGFGTAVAPQLTKSYAADDRVGLHKLLMTSSKISFFLLWLITLPVLIEISYILHLWLVEVPEYTEWFTRIIMIEALCDPLSNPMITSLLATGNIKKYQIVVGAVILFNVPLSYILLRMGLPIVIPLLVSLGISIVSLFLRLWFCKYQIALSIKTYLLLVIVPVIVVMPLSAVGPFLVTHNMEESFFRLILTVIMSALSIVICTYLFGLSGRERQLVHILVSNQFKKFK